MLQIINAATGKWKVLFALLSETGLRCGEAFGLHVEDFNLKARQVKVKRSIYRCKEVAPKTRKAHRTVDITPELCHMLEQHLNGRTQGYIFQPRNASPLNKDNSRHMLHKVLERLGIPKGGLHAFRHGRVSVLQAAGVPSDLIKQWVGHSSLKTTSRYTHFTNDYAQKMAAQNGVLNLNGPHGPHFSENQQREDGSQTAAA